MKRKITGFHTDEENHWVAELECGHGQHMRHDPPCVERPWVLTPEGRRHRIGYDLNCVRCDEFAKEVIDECRKTLHSAYADAGLSGLCNEGRFEAAVGALSTLDYSKK